MTRQGAGGVPRRGAFSWTRIDVWDDGREKEGQYSKRLE